MNILKVLFVYCEAMKLKDAYSLEEKTLKVVTPEQAEAELSSSW